MITTNHSTDAWMSEIADTEGASKDVCHGIIRLPYRLGKAGGDVQRASAHDQHHAERDQERRNLENVDEPAVGETDKDGNRHGDQEGNAEGGDLLIVESPHHDRGKAEHRTDREVEFACGHQQGHTEGHEAQFRSEGQQVADVGNRNEIRLDDGKDRKLGNKQDQWPELGAGDHALEGSGAFH